MGRIKVGKIVGTHGIKGEVRIRSSFSYKEKAFLVGTHLWIGDTEEEITSYRVHKDYDMVSFKGKNNINQVLEYKGKVVSKEKEELNLGQEEYLESDLYSYRVLTDKGPATLEEIFLASKTNKLLRIKLGEKEILVPFRKEFVTIDPKKKEIKIQLIEGM